MTGLRSSVLIIGHPNPDQVLFGADFCDDFKEAARVCESNSFSVVTFSAGSKNKEEIVPFIRALNLSNPDAQKIVVLEGDNIELLQSLVESNNLFRVLQNYNYSEFEISVQLALEESDQIQQRRDLQSMANSQNIRLKNLSLKLEEMVKKRENNLIRARKRLLSTDTKVQALHRALSAIHKANSVGEMSGLLIESLSDYLKLTWTRIFFSSASSLNRLKEQEELFTVFIVSLMHNKIKLGEIAFAREKNSQFTKEQMESLTQIADGVSLALDRLTKRDQAEGLKQQWEATFDAISDPICITDQQFNILRSNKSFAEASNKAYSHLIGQNCFKVFFDRHPNELKDLEKPEFKFRTLKSGISGDRTFEISGQIIPGNERSASVRLILLHDITDQIRMERQILESAKMAEIGMIGSSIAHELNNPLGGMISFLQLMKMDCRKDDPMFDDISEMEIAAQRCKEIIQSLLGFSRKNDLSEIKELDLRDVIQRSVKITEIQTRSRGITTVMNLPPHEVKITGNSNLLSQAICNILQNSYDSIYDIIKENPRYVGRIEISLSSTSDGPMVLIEDNGKGIDKEVLERVLNPLYSTKNPTTNSGLGLTVAYNIVTEHEGRLELSSQPKIGTSAKITFIRPESST